MASIASPSLGPLTARILYPFEWDDAYPSSQGWADELEALLCFADSQGRLNSGGKSNDDFYPRINTNRCNQRDEALNELRVARFLTRNGFPIRAWNPPGMGSRTGEFSVGTPENVTIFVEVKSPGWESELTQAERLAGRTKQPKYRDGDGGAFANWQGVRRCISSSKTYPKFDPGNANLLVIADDFFVDLHGSLQQVEIALYHDKTSYGGEMGYFASAAYENLGGVAIFAATSRGSGVEYSWRVFGNPFALPSTKLPLSLLALRA